MKTPFVNIHTHHNDNIDNQDFIEIRNIDADNISGVDVSSLYSVGIHPWSLTDEDHETKALDWIRNNADKKNFLAIGETGIDRVYKDTLERQRERFLRHIEISEEYRKPMIIHSVRSYPDIIAIRKMTRSTMPWIIHGFQGNEQSARQLLSHDMYLSLGEIMFRDEDRAMSLLGVIPRENLFLETDDSGRDIVAVYEKVCSMTFIDLDELKRDVFNNFVKIFGKI